jgi:dTDP-4-amino-4,6-dideoxygalactose transaminase|tara:strand:- start:2336 stop:2968 length:633 start_codon:yes stop_codon:yes gene_type:complete
MSFKVVNKFEQKIANFFGAPYAIAVDSCTHGIELCLRHQNSSYINVPRRTYISVPFLADKLKIQLQWRDADWVDYYLVNNHPKPIYDAAVLWKPDSYITGSYMCVSFQFQKHLSLGRGGVILCDTKEDYDILKRMSYDGRHPDTPWREQDIEVYGYHYYMTPETAQQGLDKLPDAIKTTPRQWKVTDWPDLSKMKVFNQPKWTGEYTQYI